MKSILEELFYGNICPNTDCRSSDKEIKELKDVPFIFLSARSDEYDKLLGFDLGVDDYVTKPFCKYDKICALNERFKHVDLEEW